MLIEVKVDKITQRWKLRCIFTLSTLPVTRYNQIGGDILSLGDAMAMGSRIELGAAYVITACDCLCTQDSLCTLYVKW